MCGQIILSKDEGLLEFFTELDPDLHRGFKIVHQLPYSPHPANPHEQGCYHYGQLDSPNMFGPSTVDLTDLGSPDDPDSYFRWIDDGRFEHREAGHAGIADIEEWNEIVKRITIPHYEEARGFFSDAIKDGMADPRNLGGLFPQLRLIQIIEKYNPAATLLDHQN